MTAVTVIMPCRNAAKTLARTLRSLISQTCKDWELIAIDDGSSDETSDLLAAMARIDARIRVIGGPERGVAAARNAGLKIAQSEFVAFLDADDLWVPERLAMMLWKLKDSPEVGIAYSRFAFFNREPGDNETASTVPPAPLSVLDLLGENRVGTMSNVILRRDVLEKVSVFREDMTHGEDREWLVRAAAQGTVIAGLDSLLLHYRTSPSGLSSDTEKMYSGWLQSVRTARRFGKAPNGNNLRAAEAIYLRYLSRRALRLGMPPKVAAAYALRGAAKSPRGFFAERRRGMLTLCMALAGLLSPTTVKTALAHR